MSKKNKVSVVLTSYNHAKYLRESIDSVLNQTFSDFELIIVDDASTDESWEIIKSYSDSRIQAFRSEVNTQAGGDLRKAISEVATGEHIAIHHSDDVWEPQKLEKQIVFLEENPQIGAVFSQVLIIGENGEPFDDTSHFYYNIFDQPNRSRYEWLNHFFYKSNALCHPSVLIRKVCYDDCGLYRYGLAQLADFDMWVRLCLKHEIYILPEKLVRFRVRLNEMNASSNHPKGRIRWQFETIQIYENYCAIKTPEEFVNIFPNTNIYFTQNGYDIGFALGMIALESKTFQTTKLFGLKLLFEALNDPDRARKINELYHFSNVDFVALTAEHDVFSIKLIANLTQQVAEKGRSVQALSAQVAEKTAQVAEKTVQVAEKTAQVAKEKQAAQRLQVQLDQIGNSRAWKIGLLFRRIRLAIVPPNSLRARVLRLFIKITYAPFKKTGENQRQNEDLALIQSSGLFDQDWYLANNRDVAQTKVDPLLHYWRNGGNEGRDPGPNFSSNWYLNTYEDVKKAGINPLVHYLKYGKDAGRKPKPDQVVQTPAAQSSSKEQEHLGNNLASSQAQNISEVNLREKDIQGIQPDPIIVYQMGKVGSKSVELSLLKVYETLGINVPIYHTYILNHFDEENQIAFQEQGQRNPAGTLAALADGENVRKLIDEDPAQHWNIVSLVCDPIEQNIAAFFQNLSEYIPGWHERYADGKLTLAEIQESFLRVNSAYDGFDNWFDSQIKSIPAFGIDVYETPFPHEAGYKLYPGTSQASLLLIRQENLDECAGRAMYEFLGLENFILQNINTVNEKDYADLYRTFQEMYLPSEYVERIYKTQYAQHFYTDVELELFKKRWTKNVEAEKSVLSNSVNVPEKDATLLQMQARMIKKDRAVQVLSAEVLEKEQEVQELIPRLTTYKRDKHDLDEIRRSKAWRLALLFRRIRIFLAPPKSRRIKILRQLINAMIVLFKEIRRGQKLKKDLALIRSSDLFDKTWYLANNPDVAQKKTDPALHYLLYGGFEGRDPSPKFYSTKYLEAHEDVEKSGINPLAHYLREGRKEGRTIDQDRINQRSFDAFFYMRYYPDVLNSGMDPYQHYKQHGKREGRLASPPKLELREGFAGFEPLRDTILVVSHEASRTGAPILSLNLAQNLQKKYNVVSLLLGDGSIAQYFRDESAFVVRSIPSRGNTSLADIVIEQLTELYKFKFAIVNSIESRAVLPALAKRFIPAISLIHEFASYTRPRGAFVEAVLWSYETVFSTSVTHENAVSEYPELGDHSFQIIPQGLCSVESLESDTTSKAEEETKVLNILRPAALPADTILILGVGSVQLRKGVDLFIECAARVMQSGHGEHFRFVWIGSGFNPEYDMTYSVYLLEQIRRSELQEHVFVMEETSNIEAAYKTADILLISSRLDPLPNVAIDAMMRKLPVICFERTTGIADILIANDLGEECVAPYLDTVKMADKVIAFAQSKSLRQRIGEQLQQVALKEFNMENYVSQLEQIALSSSHRMTQEQKDALEITKSEFARLDFFLPSYLNIPLDEAIRYYVRTWASGLRRRKLFPGFHPGIFLDQGGLSEPGCDPLANYLRAGQPAGPWRYDVIPSEETAQPLSPELRIALHLHIYYADLLPEMLKRLNRNQVRPDLFVSVPTELVRDEVQKLLSETYSGKVIEIQTVPNCGRDIGPFLTAFGAIFVDRYDVVGHIHTKKTADVKYSQMGKDWYTFLLENLLGGVNNMADIILGRLATDPSIGIIFPDDPHIVDWGLNRPYAEVLRQQLGINDLPENLLFPVGTMFWARIESLLPLFKLGLTWQDYPVEPLPYDGSVLHALERLLPLVASSQGFRSVLTNVTGITR